MLIFFAYDWNEKILAPFAKLQIWKKRKISARDFFQTEHCTGMKLCITFL